MTENEIKFVLKIDEDLQFRAQENGECLKIEQGYLYSRSKMTVRVRKQFESQKGIESLWLHNKFRIKNSVKGFSRVVEIASQLDKDDFEDLWKKAKGKLTKFRYKIKTGVSDEFLNPDGSKWTEVWEIDFFMASENQIYFIVAEVELPENVHEPLFEIPKLVRDNLLLRVPLLDSRFSNSKLGNVEYASTLYQSLLPKLKKEKVKL